MVEGSETKVEQSLASVYASRVFLKLQEQSKDRLKRGLCLRAAMANQIQAGIMPTGYRADFLHETSRAIIDLLCDAAEKFNNAHLDDLCSSSDLLDALMTSRKKIIDGCQISESGLETIAPEAAS